MINKDYSKEQAPQSKQIHQSDPRSQPILLPFLKLYNFIIGAGAVPVRLLFFRNIGERSISPLAWLISGGAHLYYAFVYALGFVGSIAWITLWFFDNLVVIDQIGNDLDTLGWFNSLFLIFNGVTIYFVHAFIVNGYRHFISNPQKETNILKVGSYYRGEPIFSKKEDFLGKVKWTIFGKKEITEKNFHILIEPHQIFMLGLVVVILFTILSVLVFTFYEGVSASVATIFLLSYNSAGGLMSLSAICLFLEEKGIDQRIRDSALDLIDAPKDLDKILRKRDEIVEIKSSPIPLKKRKGFPVVKID